MKHLIALITLLSASLWAQSISTSGIPSASSPANGPSYSQLYCSGFVTRNPIPRTNYILGSKDSPHQDRLAIHSLIFLSGSGFVEGQRYSILRQVADSNHEDSSPEQRKKLAKLGALYQEIGWVTVKSVQPAAAIATFDFACDAAVRGDIIVPYKEKTAVFYRTSDPSIDSYRAAANQVHGHILGAKDFDSVFGTDQIVYTDFGSAKGARPGDYLTVLRGYAPEELNVIDRTSDLLPKGADDLTVKPPKIKANADNRIPQHVLGEVLVLNVTPESSTALITRTFDEMQLGDVVQGEGSQAASSQSAQSDDCHPASRLHRLTHLQLHASCKAQ